MKTKFARREFLKQLSSSVASVGGGAVLFEALLRATMSKAWASAGGANLNPSGYYIYMTFPGALPRWMFDLPLTPNGKTTQNFVAGSFGTRIEKVGSVWKSIYDPEPVTAGGKTIHLAPVWKMNVADQNFSQLLPHTLFVRGMDMEIDSHNISNARQVSPIIGGYSLNGVTADGATRPMPCVVDASSHAGGAFRSKQGLSASQINYSESATVNPVGTLLKAFQNFMGSRPAHTEANKALQDQALTEFDRFATNLGVTKTSLNKMYDNAIEMIDDNVYQLSTQWATTVAKYRNIMGLALRPTKGQLPGIFDQTIPATATAPFRVTLEEYANRSDIRDIITANTIVPRMAENFAVAELLIDRISSTFNLSFGNLGGVSTGTSTSQINNDQHFVGNVISTMCTTLVYRAFLGCLTEFVSQLKTKNIFSRTVIHISSEFNRTPRADGSGSDHGFMAGNATLISGMINGPNVVGNITKAGLSSNVPGTFGVAAPYLLDGYNRPIQVNDVARTITAMLGVDDIVTNGYSILEPSGGLWVPRKAEANNVG